MRNSSVQNLRIAIVDQQSLSREGLYALVIRMGIPASHVMTFAALDALEEHLNQHSVHLLLLTDSTLPTPQPLLHLKRLHEQHPGIRVMLLSPQLHTDYIQKVFHHGAYGFIYQQGRLEDTLPMGIKLVGQGEVYLSPEAAALPYFAHSIPRQLKQRDLEVLHLLSQGWMVRDIAQKLGVDRKVVYRSRDKLRQVLGAGNNEQIVSAALAQGLITFRMP